MVSLIPQPRSLTSMPGGYVLSSQSRIALTDACVAEDLVSAQLLQDQIFESLGMRPAITRVLKDDVQNGDVVLDRVSGEPQSYSLRVSPEGIRVCGGDGAGLFYGVQTLRQLIRAGHVEIPALEAHDKPAFADRGFYHDITRGKVPTLDTLFELVDRASFYKLNQIQLYVEHSFAFRGHSEVWIGADPITAEEILFLDDYCMRRHVELVPSLATFGHLYEMLRSRTFAHLCELENSTGSPYSWVDRQRNHTLNAALPESLEAVKDMIDQYVPLFSSARFNICCDETWGLGAQRSREEAQRIGKGRLFADFLRGIVDHVRMRGKQVMMWGDGLWNYADCLTDLPRDVIILSYDYAADVKVPRVSSVAELGFDQYVCPGVRGWNRLMNDMDVSFANIRGMVELGRKYHAIGVLNTDWGDHGHVNLLANSMPGMIYGASLSWNPDGDSDAAEQWRRISVTEYGDPSGSLVELLADLARQQIVPWGVISAWAHWKSVSSLFPEADRECPVQCDPDGLVSAGSRALEIGAQIARLRHCVRKDRFDDMDEFEVSARGIHLCQALALIIKKRDLGQHVSMLLVEPWPLAEQLELWMMDYAAVWRRRNKESELYRIRDVITTICAYLRS